jgi:hypothetical protein
MLDQNIVQAAMTRLLLGRSVGGLLLLSPGAIQLDKLLLKLDNLRGKFNDFCYTLIYGTGNTND